MRYATIFFIVMILAIPVGASTEHPELKTSLDKLSYGYGFIFVKQFQKFGIFQNIDAFKKGINDYYTNTKPIVTSNVANAITEKIGKLYSENELENKKWTDEQLYKIAYSLGYTFSEFTRHIINVMLNADVVKMGVDDGFSGKPLPYTEEEIDKFTEEIYGQRRQEARKQWLEKCKKTTPRSAQWRYIEENKEKPGFITTQNGLQYKVLKEGKGIKPKKDDIIYIRYNGTLLDGKEFDAPLIKRDVQKTHTWHPTAESPIGIKEAILMMPEGSRWQIVVPPELGFGEEGVEERVCPNSVLIYDIELVKIGEKNSTNAEE